MSFSQKLKLSTATQKHIDQLLQQMTLAEKCAFVAGMDNWRTVPLPRLGIKSLVVTDGPHGVRPAFNDGKCKVGNATYFPTGVSMGATWNQELLEEVGQALGEETRAYGCDVLLGPCINIMRSPLAGRNFESMTEDPFLAGRLAAAWINGIQSKGVGASLKHFACNNQEHERMRGSSEVDERTLREIYLPHFEYAVKNAQPWTVMCAYNRINGTYASQHELLLTDILRKEWEFEGLVMSDWGAVHSIFEAIAAGLDLEMPGPGKYTKLLADAVINWQIPEAKVTRAVRHVLELLAKTGQLGKDGKIIAGSANTKAHQQLARRVAAEAVTLLKNDGSILPLNLKKLKSLAVIGINAAQPPQGGGSSAVPAPYRVAALEAIKTLVGKGFKVKYHHGCSNSDGLCTIDHKLLTVPNSRQQGIFTEYYANTDWSGSPVGTGIENNPDRWWHGDAETSPAPGLELTAFSGRWTTCLTADGSGKALLGVDIQGHGRVFLDGKLLFNTHPFSEGTTWGTGRKEVTLEKGRKYLLAVEFVYNPPATPMHVKILYQPPLQQDELDAAARVAARCDVALIFAGHAEGAESEGFDLPHMKLPGNQDRLIEAVRQANPRTVVVLNTGVPVEMPWADNISAILQAYYPGQEGGNAIADILFGLVNPSGKLSVSYPKLYHDNPSYPNFPGNREVCYGEGIFVGYRYYDIKGVAPLFPFGHGLSYTEFEYSKLKLPKSATAGADVKVSLAVKNVGKVLGKEVVQLYVADLDASVARPEKELKGFAKVELRPGESRDLEFILDARAFSFYDVVNHQWLVEPGKFVIMAGSSSRDLRVKGSIVLR